MCTIGQIYTKSIHIYVQPLIFFHQCILFPLFLRNQNSIHLSTRLFSINPKYYMKDNVYPKKGVPFHSKFVSLCFGGFWFENTLKKNKVVVCSHFLTKVSVWFFEIKPKGFVIGFFEALWVHLFPHPQKKTFNRPGYCCPNVWWCSCGSLHAGRS